MSDKLEEEEEREGNNDKSDIGGGNCTWRTFTSVLMGRKRQDAGES